jgi:hypothetical protein
MYISILPFGLAVAFLIAAAIMRKLTYLKVFILLGLTYIFADHLKYIFKSKIIDMKARDPKVLAGSHTVCPVHTWQC